MDLTPGFERTYPMRKRQNRRSLRVFLVEDLPVVRNRVMESLGEIEGVEVAGFADGEDSAISWLRRERCDVVILDLELRQGNGLGVLKALAAEGSRPDLVKIVYSNHAGSNVRRIAAQFGASYFFDKTLDTPKLGPLLEQLSAAAA